MLEQNYWISLALFVMLDYIFLNGFITKFIIELNLILARGAYDFVYMLGHLK